MQNILSIESVRNNSKILILDIILLITIYLTPALTHLFSLPVYVIEPMRLAVFASILFTNRTNSLIIAVTLPLFSLVTSGHPVFAKALLISAELSINVMLFYWFSSIVRNKFISAAGSIFLSKAIYYLLKYAVISAGFLVTSLISTSLLVQLVVMTVTAVSVYLVSRLVNKN